MASTERLALNVPRPMTSQEVSAAPVIQHFGELLTVEEVAEMLKVPMSWVYERTRRRSADRIPGFRLGKYWRFREADVLAWIERRRIGARPNA